MRWTREEDDIIRQFYPTEGVGVCRMLPNRTEGACQARAQKLHVHSGKRWTKEEDDILREFYPVDGCGVFTRLPYRSKAACHIRASTLGLSSAAKPKG